jgi:uncharacterized membrane protein YjgN (DUF898 family)
MSDIDQSLTARKPSVPAWVNDLEDGPLKRELGGAPRFEPVAEVMAYQQPLKFHGRGSEYFRIWVVNVFLTLITLGIYSAWAKVRKARWFAQNTSLAGDHFDFHANPKRILIGRLVAVGLLVLWSVSFKISAWFGLAVLALFCVVGPLLFASAQRFRLANTSWRGLRFGFDAPRTTVYWVLVPVLLVWTAGSVVDAFDLSAFAAGAAGLATLVCFPWAHARLKMLQHHHANFGQQKFSFQAAGPEFYGLYAKGFALAVAAGALMVPLAFAIIAAGRAVAGKAAMPWIAGLGFVSVLVMWAGVWPYFATRMQKIVWSHTKLGPIRFEGRMTGWRLWRLVLGQSFLTIITLGLYWPFAAVAIARYRVESIVVEAPGPFADVAAALGDSRQTRAAGDAAADFFGLDVGW